MPKRFTARPSDSLNWHSFAELMAGAFSLERLDPDVLAWMAKNTEKGPWSIACSGGADSVCMVLLLFKLFPHRCGKMHVLHFNHRLRNEASDKDALFVESLAVSLGMPFHTGVMAPIDENKLNELLAREARFNFFTEKMNRIKSRVLFLGHIKEDIAETMLMRLARGSGSKGLAAPRPVHYHRNEIVHLRPLLNIAKFEIKECMNFNRIPWCDDDSNFGDQFLRNRLRHSVLPAWREAEERNVDEGASRARRFLEEDDQALESWLDEVGIRPIAGEVYNFSHLLDKPAALIRRMLNRWLEAHSLIATLSREATETLFKSIINGQMLCMSAGENNFIKFDNGCLELIEAKNEPHWPPLFVPVNSDLFLPHGTHLVAEAIEMNDELRDSIMSGTYSECNHAFIRRLDEKANSGFEVRQWRAGDRYQPLGAPGSSKLQDLFTDRKISIEERKRLPIVCNDQDKILWIPGLPPAESHKIQKFTNNALRLTYMSS